LVVDNASTDETSRVIQDMTEAHEVVRSTHEAELGLSRARNTALRQARGDIVAYLDDDAIAPPSWLSSILQAFETASPAPGSVGGPIHPLWEVEPPPWLHDDLHEYLSLYDWSDEPTFLGNEMFLAGANLAFSRSLLMEAGGFPSQLGRVGNHLLSGGDTAAYQALAARGSPPLYVPAAKVYHCIPADRLTQRWFIRRSFWDGASGVALNRLRGNPSPLRLFLRAARSGLQLLPDVPLLCRGLLAPPRSPEAFKRLCQRVSRLGRLCASLGLVPRSS
jgi:glycosyltransferase involved in cell wall biosynthesis